MQPPTTPTPTKILERLRSLKALRDHPTATPGERAAADNRLNHLLAKYNLTHSDIPPPDERGAFRPFGFRPPPRTRTYRPPPHRPPPPPRHWGARREESGWQTREARTRRRPTRRGARVGTETNPHPNPNQPPLTTFFVETSTKVTYPGTLLKAIAEPFGFTVTRSPVFDRTRFLFAVTTHDPHTSEFRHIVYLYSTLARYLKREAKRHSAHDRPKNKAAWKRAFYEQATTIIADRICNEDPTNRTRPYSSPHSPHSRPKNRNPEGKASGELVGKNIFIPPYRPAPRP